ncbi:MAG: hypothetical protein KA956_12805 [Pyrinomonadaceae bacterium]|nr:hypothetical protein [Acidobacteriota bacterium]MBP7377348.1 hypothetical protein [Pyrinomonadaceae bacterium]
MKICPSCQSSYTDETLRFCLQDGTELIGSNSGNYPTQVLPEMETVVRRDPITTDDQKIRMTHATVTPDGRGSNTLLIVGLTAVGMCVLFGGIAAAWLFMGSNSSKTGSGLNSNYKTPTVMPTISANANTDAWTLWEPIDFNASLNGDRLTFYRGTTYERCQADCDADPKCRAFGLVRAGFYNPEDPPMCYLLTKVTGSTPSACCISGIKKAP